MDTDKGFLTINQVSGYLQIRPSTLYLMVKDGEIPCYRVHNMIRFKQEDIDVWMESHKSEKIDRDKRAKGILREIDKSARDIDLVVKKSIDEVKGNLYTLGQGRSDRIRDLGKGVKDGTL
jgi:excisionase family DNA binding protein